MARFAGEPPYRPPRDCPVCGHGLEVTRLGCGSCGTELSGVFEACSFCGLSDADRELLRVFLVSRGNLREVERHLGVSYPTARQRYADLLVKLGLEDGATPAPVPAPAVPTVPAAPAEPAPGPPPGPERDEILAKLASGDLDVDAAAEQLRSPG